MLVGTGKPCGLLPLLECLEALSLVESHASSQQTGARKHRQNCEKTLSSDTRMLAIPITSSIRSIRRGVRSVQTRKSGRILPGIVESPGAVQILFYTQSSGAVANRLFFFSGKGRKHASHENQ